MLLLAIIGACAKAPPPSPIPLEPSAELVIEGTLQTRVSTASADLVVFYMGEHKGSLETCGCPKRPRGSLPRVGAYLNASRDANPDTRDLLVHGGYWLEDSMGVDGGLREDVPMMNSWMVQGLDAIALDAANVSFQDLPGLTALDQTPAWIVSANVTLIEGSDAPAPAPWRIIERDGLRIGITGITEAGVTFVPAPDYLIGDPFEAGLPVLQALAPQVDVMILLAFQASRAAKALAEAVPELDVVVDTAMHREFSDPFVVNQATWVRSHYQTMRLGELRLGLTKAGGVETMLDRKIDMDPEVPDAPELRALMKDARRDLERLQAELYGP